MILLNYLTVYDQISWLFLLIFLLFKKFDFYFVCLLIVHIHTDLYIPLMV